MHRLDVSQCDSQSQVLVGDEAPRRPRRRYLLRCLAPLPEPDEAQSLRGHLAIVRFRAIDVRAAPGSSESGCPAERGDFDTIASAPHTRTRS
jgi:hypothetical protein